MQLKCLLLLSFIFSIIIFLMDYVYCSVSENFNKEKLVVILEESFQALVYYFNQLSQKLDSKFQSIHYEENYKRFVIRAKLNGKNQHVEVYLHDDKLKAKPKFWYMGDKIFFDTLGHALSQIGETTHESEFNQTGKIPLDKDTIYRGNKRYISYKMSKEFNTQPTLA